MRSDVDPPESPPKDNDPGNEAEVPEGWSELGRRFRDAPRAESSFDGVDGGAVRKRADAFARTIRHRNIRELAGGGFVIVAGFVIASRATTTLALLGGLAMSAGALIVSAVLLVRARNLPAPDPAAPTSEVLAYERAQLERQAALLERIWIWYLAPLLPSVVLIYADGVVREISQGSEVKTTSVAATVTMLAASLGVFFFIGWLNKRTARRLRERMARIDPP